MISPSRSLFGSVLIGASAVLLAAGAPAAPSSSLTLSPCHLDKLAEQVRCGALEVFEDRDTATGRRLPIQVTVLPALVRDPEPDPLVVLAGGPGQGARAYAPLVPRFFQRIRRTRDVVLVDLRGTGDSAPLNCSTPPGATVPLTFFETPEESAKDCLEGLSADPRFYTHRYALADLRDVVQQLGYRRINVWGGSWGTRSALIFAATYPDLVRTAVLDGAVAATMDFPWSYPRDAQRALDRLFDDCAQDAACRAAFPHARDEVAGWLARLERQPFLGTVRHPRSAALVEIRLDRASATEVLRAALYSSLDASRILMVIHLAVAGELAPLVAMAERSASWSVDTMALGQTLSILCSEDVGRRRSPEMPMNTMFGRSAVESWLARCEAWPKGPALDIDERTVLPVPAMILSGELDPVTPPARGDEMRRHFPNSLHVVAPGGSHNVSFSGCLPRLMAEFVEQGTWRALDPSCVKAIARPPFVTSFAGERP